MKLEIVKGKDQPILHIVCDPVTEFDKTLKKLVDDMKQTMKSAKGLGIAAPQVNVNARVFIVTLGYGEKGAKELAMVNPEIIEFSEKKNIAEEGCLSLPNVFGNVSRSSEILVKFQDVSGTAYTLRLNDLDARVVQHEMDHLNGVLFIEKLDQGVVM